MFPTKMEVEDEYFRSLEDGMPRIDPQTGDEMISYSPRLDGEGPNENEGEVMDDAYLYQEQAEAEYGVSGSRRLTGNLEISSSVAKALADVMCGTTELVLENVVLFEEENEGDVDVDNPSSVISHMSSNGAEPNKASNVEEALSKTRGLRSNSYMWVESPHEQPVHKPGNKDEPSDSFFDRTLGVQGNDDYGDWNETSEPEPQDSLEERMSASGEIPPLSPWQVNALKSNPAQNEGRSDAGTKSCEYSPRAKPEGYQEGWEVPDSDRRRKPSYSSSRHRSQTDSDPGFPKSHRKNGSKTRSRLSWVDESNMNTRSSPVVGEEYGANTVPPPVRSATKCFSTNFKVPIGQSASDIMGTPKMSATKIISTNFKVPIGQTASDIMGTPKTSTTKCISTNFKVPIGQTASDIMGTPKTSTTKSISTNFKVPIGQTASDIMGTPKTDFGGSDTAIRQQRTPSSQSSGLSFVPQNRERSMSMIAQTSSSLSDTDFFPVGTGNKRSSRAFLGDSSGRKISDMTAKQKKRLRLPSAVVITAPKSSKMQISPHKVASYVYRNTDQLGPREHIWRPEDTLYREYDHQVAVELKATYLKINDIDTVSQQFEAEIYIQAKWQEDAFIGMEASDLKDLMPEDLWDPHLIIVNVAGDFDNERRSFVARYEEGYEAPVVLLRWRFKGLFREPLQLQHFPFDVQDLSIQVSTERSVDEMKMKHDQHHLSSVNTRAFQDSQEWTLYKHVECRHLTTSLEYASSTIHPILVFSCRVRRKVWYFIWNVVFIVFLVMLLSFLTISVEPTTSDRLSNTMTLFLTMVAFKLVVKQSLPTISYLTYLDIYVLGSLIYLVVFAFENSIVCYISRWMDRELVEAYDRVLCLMLAFVLVAFHLIFILYIQVTALKRHRLMKHNDKQYALQARELKKKHDTDSFMKKESNNTTDKTAAGNKI